MEVVVVWSMLVWNAPRTPPTDRLSITATDNPYLTENECWNAARQVIEHSPKARVACLQTTLAQSELEAMKKLERIAEKAMRDFPDDPNP